MIASLATWRLTSPLNRIVYVEEKYKWVAESAATNAAIERQYILKTSVECLEPHYNNAIRSTQKKLIVHEENMPEELREWLTSEKERGNRFSQMGTKDEKRRASLRYKSNELRLKRKYKEWFSQKKDIKSRLKWLKNNMKDIRPLTISSEKIDQKIRETFFTKLQAIVALLDLNVFDIRTAKDILHDCVEKYHYKKVVSDTHLRSNIERWPRDFPITFWASIGLVIFGVSIRPIYRWINKD
jgi:hypothetical protein